MDSGDYDRLQKIRKPGELQFVIISQKINEEFANGETMDPESPMCHGSAPMCPNMGSTTAAPTTQSTTPSGPDFPCNGDGEINAYPGNCHWYYRCSDPDGDGTYDTQVNIRLAWIRYDKQRGLCNKNIVIF